jgi:hypothetical protein
MTKAAFKQSWADVLKRAGISDLTFHDLRREAGSRFDEAGLTKGEQDLMMGHANRDMTSLYVHAYLKSIQDKLDRYVLDGMTFDEAMQDKGCIVTNRGISGAPKAVDFDEWADSINETAMRFKSRQEADEYVARLKQSYANNPFTTPFPPELTSE